MIVFVSHVRTCCFSSSKQCGKLKIFGIWTFVNVQKRFSVYSPINWSVNQENNSVSGDYDWVYDILGNAQANTPPPHHRLPLAWKEELLQLCGVLVKYREPWQDMESDPYCVSIGECISEPGGRRFDVVLWSQDTLSDPDWWIQSRLFNNHQRRCSQYFSFRAEQLYLRWKM